MLVYWYQSRPLFDSRTAAAICTLVVERDRSSTVTRAAENRCVRRNVETGLNTPTSGLPTLVSLFGLSAVTKVSVLCIGFITSPSARMGPSDTRTVALQD